MIVDLRKLEHASGRLQGTDRVEVVDALGETVEVDCAVDVRYSQSGGAYHLEVTVNVPLETSCHRCLDPVRYPLEADFDLVVRRGGGRGERPDEDGAGDNYIIVGTNEHEISLHPYIHENVVVSIPMLVLCDDECRGLCPVCGTNRNHNDCTCRPDGD
jgi:uncharacterized protein